jgi:hypothetical protein
MDPWYPPASEYYVSSAETQLYPPRQGDLFGPIEVNGKTHAMLQLVHPTCEIGKPAVEQVQVCATHSLVDLPNNNERSWVVAGMRERDGRFLVAQAHTFYLPSTESEAAGRYSNFRQMLLVDRDAIDESTRLAAITHDCRVHFIRRWLYFRFRIPLSVAQVRELEAERIRGDVNFVGPRPAWAK